MRFISRRQWLHAAVSTSAVAGLAGNGLASAQTAAPPAAGLSALEAIRQRRSVRRFKSTPITDEQLQQILDAGRLAPTSSNQQPWRFLVVKDRAKLDLMRQDALAQRERALKTQGLLKADEIAKRLANAAAYIDGMLAAPVHIIVLVEKESRHPEHNLHDGMLAAGQIMLAARALGYGSVCLTYGIPPETTQRVLAIPVKYERICMIPIGLPAHDTPDRWPGMPAKKNLTDIVAYEQIT